MPDWTTLDYLVAGASAITIVGACYAGFRWGGAVMRTFWRWFTRFKPTVPRETIRAVPLSRPWWHMGSSSGQPAMQVATRWLVTNISDRPTILTSVSMSRGWLRGRYEGRVIADDVIPEGAALEVGLDFWVQPPFRKNGQNFSARFVLIDHLGNAHHTRRITIPSDWRPKIEKPKPKEESIVAVADPLVRQVISILKDEADRYKECGRSVGGLGSVQVTYDKRTLVGIGYQGRKSNSPSRQWIVPDPQNASLRSDNLDALLVLFNRQDEDHKQTIINALLQRIGPTSEYTPVSYFIILTLWRMGQLPAALRAITDKLNPEEKYGFDDAVMMLSGLLQYEHPNFDCAILDEVENFLNALSSPTHHLRERYIATRAASVTIEPHD